MKLNCSALCRIKSRKYFPPHLQHGRTACRLKSTRDTSQQTMQMNDFEGKSHAIMHTFYVITSQYVQLHALFIRTRT